MLKFKRIVLYTLMVLVLVVFGLYFSGNGHIFRGLMYTYLEGKTGPTIDDGLRFDRDTLKSVNPQPWAVSEQLLSELEFGALNDSLEKYDPVALLVIDNDSIVFERYWDDYSEESRTNSYSMAKSVVGLMIGVAIDDGYIKSVEEPVANYFPEYSDSPGDSLRIRHLLQMSSGIDFGESYSGAFGYVAKAYYGYDIASLTLKYVVSSPPGEEFKYQGGNTQLLAMIIEKASGKRFSDYVEDKIWSKIGAVEDAWWTVDEEGMVRASCCLYTNARDYARLVRLMMNGGEWNGEQIIPEDYVAASLSPVMNMDTEGDIVDYYGYQWWLGSYEGSSLYALRGLQGQYIIGVPDRDLIVVRLGRERSKTRRDHMPIDMYHVLELGCRLDR